MIPTRGLKGKLEMFVTVIPNQGHSAVLLNPTSRQRYKIQAPPRACNKGVNIRFSRPGLPHSLDVTQMNFSGIMNLLLSSLSSPSSTFM
jgi:hypothetical protein